MSRNARAALALDLLCVLIFVAIGRRSHDEGGNALVGALRVAAPFLIGVVVSWAAGRLWRDAISTPSAMTVWIGTVAVGMVLRRFVFDRGTALAFIIVTAVMLFAFFNGWRAAWRWRLAR